MQRPRTPTATDEETLALWYELGRLYSESGGGGQRATKLGFTVVCAAGALVLLSAPVFGTAWAGPFAAAIPVAVGLLSGGGLFLRQRSLTPLRCGRCVGGGSVGSARRGNTEYSRRRWVRARTWPTASSPER